MTTTTNKKIKKRLEYLRKELRAERISYGELFELQSLAEHIEDGDVELLQAAGVEENAEPKTRRTNYMPDDVIPPKTAYLCKCNKCDIIMFDQNPQVGATLHKPKGDEVEMQYVQGLNNETTGDQEMFWACPVCLTDEYLTDL